jgi:N-acetylglucosamine-6-sulfatase
VQALPLLDAERTQAVDDYRRAQLETLLAVDRSVGRIIDALRAAGRLHNTLVVFTSDNGLGWGEHRWTNKQHAYEESVRVPLVMRYGSGTQEAREVPNLALNIDLTPTFTALSGLVPSGVDGRSLLPVLEGRPGPSRSGFLIEHLQLWPKAPPPTFCAVHTRRYLYVVYVTGERELYDLEADPYELQNRAADPAMASVESRLAGRLHDLCHPPPPGMERP